MYLSNSFFIRKRNLTFFLVFPFFKKIIIFFFLFFISKFSSLLLFKNNKNSFYIYGYPSENYYNPQNEQQLYVENFNKEFNSQNSCIERQLRLARYLNVNLYQLRLTTHGNISHPFQQEEIISNYNDNSSSNDHTYALAAQEVRLENENTSKTIQSEAEKYKIDNSNISFLSSSLVDNSPLKYKTSYNSLKNADFLLPFPTSHVFPLSMHLNDKSYSSSSDKNDIKKEKINQIESTDNVLLRVLLKNGMKSVFRLKVIRIHPDFAKPWLVSRDLYSSGTAFAIDDRKILTNAHVVTFAHTIFVERHGDPRLYNAKLEVIAHEIDLAILTINDDEFWKDVMPFHMPKSSCYSSCSCGKKQENLSEYCKFSCHEIKNKLKEEPKKNETNYKDNKQNDSSCSNDSENKTTCNLSDVNDKVKSSNTPNTIDSSNFSDTNASIPIEYSYEQEAKCIIQDTLDIPNVLDVVLVMGYPVGGTSISITKGVVNRVEVGTYYHSNHKFLLIQIDAASNRGNSGGPVLNMQGEVIGVVFQGITNAQSVGYVIPVPIIYHLLNDVRRHNKYTGIADLGVFTTPLRNPSLKKYLNIYKEKVRSKLHENNITTDTNYLGCVVTNVNERNIKNYFKILEQTKKNENKKINNQDIVENSINCSDSSQKFPEKKKFNETNKNLLMNVSFSLFKPKLKLLKKNISNVPTPTDSPSIDEKKSIYDEYEQIFKKDYTLFYEEKPQTNDQEKLIPEQKQIGLKVGDILVAFDGKVIGEDCTVQFRESDRLSMSYLLTGRYENSSVVLTVIRNKNVIDVIAPLAVNKFVVPIHNWNSQARYIIFGGFVFVELNKSFVLDAPCDAESKWSIAAAAKKFSRVWKNDELEEAVVLSVVLSNDLTKGYEYENVQLISVNGIKVKNLRHLYDLLNMQFCVEYVRKQFNMIAEINIDSSYLNQINDFKDKESDVKSNGEDFVTFIFDGVYDIVVMDRIEAIKMLPKILLTHHIASPVSFGV